MNERSLSAEEVDLMIGRTWFSQEGAPAGDVTVHDQRVTLPELDAEQRASELGHAERRLFVDGLRVEGPVRLGRGVRAIYVVLGELRAGSIELGDGVLAVSGRVSADDYVYLPRTEGTFAVGPDATSDDATVPALPPVQAPLVLWYDPRRRADLVFRMGAKALERVATADLPPALKELYDADGESFKDHAAVREVLRSGRWR